MDIKYCYIYRKLVVYKKTSHFHFNEKVKKSEKKWKKCEKVHCKLFFTKCGQDFISLKYVINGNNFMGLCFRCYTLTVLLEKTVLHGNPLKSAYDEIYVVRK